MGDGLDPELSALVEEGEQRLRDDDYAGAAALYRSVLERCPTVAGCWHDLGIATKHLKRWEECRAVNRRALELNPGDEGAAWNLGIAGTALGDWITARQGWRAAGIDIPCGDGPVEMELGRVPIRVAVDTNPEVVWCKRIDPARAIILNVPTAASGRRYRDLVLHDGSQAGERLLDGQPVPVFNELAVLTSSPFSTYEMDVEASRPEDLMALEQVLDASGGISEDWTASVRNLCRACSEGNPDAGKHAHPFEDGWNSRRRLGFATEQDDAAVQALLTRWVAREHVPLLRRWAKRGERTLVSVRRVTAGAASA